MKTRPIRVNFIVSVRRLRAMIAKLEACGMKEGAFVFPTRETEPYEAPAGKFVNAEVHRGKLL